MHTFFDAQQPLSKVHISAEEIKRAYARSIPGWDQSQSIQSHQNNPLEIEQRQLNSFNDFRLFFTQFVQCRFLIGYLTPYFLE